MKTETYDKRIAAAVTAALVILAAALVTIAMSITAVDPDGEKGISKPFDWNGYRLRFVFADIIRDEPLSDGSSPTRDVAMHLEDRVELTWEPARDRKNMDGYVVLRRLGGEKEFTELARVDREATGYIDRTVMEGTEAFYTIVGYKMSGERIRISSCCGTEMFPKERAYQNPDGLVQIGNRISTHGYNYYTAPVLVDSSSSREEHIEAMISTAYEYLGDPYENRCSTRPGEGVDCSGLIMQAAYGAGVDLWPSNPYRHRYGADRYEWESREIAKMDSLKTVPYEERERGDLIFYTHGDDVITHVSLYLGKDRVIHSYKKGVGITETDYNKDTAPYLVKRIFN